MKKNFALRTLGLVVASFLTVTVSAGAASADSGWGKTKTVVSVNDSGWGTVK